MIKLKDKFNKNGLPYFLIKRNEVVALYGIAGEYDKKTIRHYEVSKIYIQKAQFWHGKNIPETEHIPSNEQFGNDKSICVSNKEWAESYYEWFTNYLKSTPVERKKIKPFIKPGVKYV